MRAPQERTMRDLYDHTPHKDLAPREEPAEGRGGGRAEGSGRRELVAKMEEKTIVRKRLVSNDKSGTCNVCYAPCSSCLHRGLAHVDSNIDCGSSQTCSTRSEIKNNSLTLGEKGVRNREDIDDEFSAASSNASYSETGGNKAATRSSIAEDSSEVDMPTKRRRISNQDMKLSRAEYNDDSNSCVTGMPVEGKLLLEKKMLSTSASSRDLTVNGYKDSSIASHGRLRKQHIDESKEKNGSDVIYLSSSMTKKLMRTQSSVSASKGLSPKRQAHEVGEPQENLSRQRCEKTLLQNNIVEQPLKSNPGVDAGDNNGMLAGCSASTRNEKKSGFSRKDLENDTSCSKDQIQEHAAAQTIDDAKRNGADKQDWDQDSSMDISSDGELNIQNDVTTDCGNSEGLIDVNVCDICGDVGREYLLATCTRCFEGAEHTYCMRVKLDKIPDGEWLCEECQLKDYKNKARCKDGVRAINISEGKKQNSENQRNPKALRVVVPNLDAPQINCSTPTAEQCVAKNKKSCSESADTQPRQVRVTTSAAERLDVKNKNVLSMANRKKLQVVTSDLEARPHTSGIPTPGSSNKKTQSSEFMLNRKKLRVSTDMESPLSSEGLRSPPISCKRQAENTSSPNPRLFKANSLKKHDGFSRETSFKKSNKGSLSSLDNGPVRIAQAVKSSHTLSRSYSMGSMLNAKTPVPSPRGPLSKQLSFNSSNNVPKVKQLAEGVASKLRPVKHSPRDLRDHGPIKKFMKSGSFKSESSFCKDAGSSKQKQSFHMSQDEKPVTMKPIKEKNMMERRASFNFKKPNIPSSPRPDSSMKSSPRPDSSMKSGERKLDQDISRPGTSILKSSKKPGNVEKESSDLSKSDKREITVHQKPAGFVSGKDVYTENIPDPPISSQCVKKDEITVHQKPAGFVSGKDVYTENIPDPPIPSQCVKKDEITVHQKPAGFVSGKDVNTENIPDPPIPSQCVKKDSSDDVKGDSIVSVKDGNAMQTEPPEVLPTTPDAMTLESDLHDLAPRVSALDDLAFKVECCEQKPLESTVNGSCKSVEAAQASDDTLPKSLHGLPMIHNGYPTDDKLDKPNLKQEVFLDESTPENLSRDFVIPEQSYLWQGSFEVSRHGNSPEIFDGIQAYLSSCASFKVREVGKQLPHKIQLAEVPRHASWPLQFKEINPTEDDIALFFFAKDAESYERAYAKLLEDMVLGDLSLTTNIGGTELLIFPSDKLPQRTQRWNGLLFFWGIFYARKASCPPELPVTETNNCSVEPVTAPVIKHEVGSPKVLQSLGIDLNECPYDDSADLAVSLGSEMEKSGASVHQNILLNSCEMHQEETAAPRQIVLGHATAAPCGTHLPSIPTGHDCDMIKNYPSSAKGIIGIAGTGAGNIEEEGFCRPEALLSAALKAGAVRSISDEIVVKKQAFEPSAEVSPWHFNGSNISDDPNKLIPKSGIDLSDSDSSYKRQKTSHGKHSASFEDGQLPNKCLSKIHPLPAGQHNAFGDAQYTYRGSSDPSSLKKPIPDHIIHVLSSDDEDSPVPSPSLNNKASLKADEGSSPLLSLSLSTATTKHNLAGSNIGEDEPLSLSLGLPVVVEGNRVLEMKQFLPEKPGINT